MSLKKTDKIIAVVGVVILIVAVFGILFYYEPEDAVDGDDDGMVTKEFEVYWTDYTVEEKIKGDAGKNSPYKKPINISLDEGCVLSIVEIRIDWEDDYTKGLIFNKGEDTLTAEFTPENGEMQRHSKKKSGNETFVFPINTIIPQNEIIEDVEDIFAAEDKIEEDYAGLSSTSFDVRITVKPGESFFTLRPIKFLNFLRDQGNGFELFVTYKYYKPDIIEIQSGNSDGNPVDNNTNGYTGAGVYTSTNYALSKL
ncbi:MAG: hypothetical protein KAW45_05590 [Thermoplasmatales archaeon]|nr:hypothetical protein [Thermoplasmatales archaeon]